MPKIYRYSNSSISEEMTELKRYDWADFARGLLMVLVFIYHSEVYYGNEHSYSWIFVPFFLTGFFFVSGFFFTKDINCVSFKVKLKQVIRGIIFPYFVFELLRAAPKVLMGRSDIVQLLIDFFLFRGGWFVISVGVMQLLYGLILDKKPSLKKVILGTVLFFVLGIGLCWIYDDSCPIRDYVIGNRLLFSYELPNRLPFCFNIAMLYCPFFALGIVGRIYEGKLLEICKIKHLIISLILYIALYCIIDHFLIGSNWNGATGTYHNLPLMVLYAIIGIWLVICISNVIKQIQPINFIGRYSILFLFMNGGSLLITSLLIQKNRLLNPAIYSSQLIVAILALMLACLAALLINRFFPLLRGDKDAFNRLSKRLGFSVSW